MILLSKRKIISTAVIWVTLAILLMPGRMLISIFAGIASILILALYLAKLSNRKYDRLANRQCVNCGYDLRASKDRCPECGAAFGFGWGGMLEE